MSTKNWTRNTSWLVLGAFAMNTTSAFARGDSKQNELRQIEEGVEEIVKDMNIRYEAATPGLKATLADRMLSVSKDGVTRHGAEMLQSFRNTVIESYELARDGVKTRDGKIVLLGAKDGWKFFKQFGKAAGIHYLDSVYLIPEKISEIGDGFGAARDRSIDLAGDNWDRTRSAFQRAGQNIRQDLNEAADGYRAVSEWAGDSYSQVTDFGRRGIEQGVDLMLDGPVAVTEWSRNQMQDAAHDLTHGTAEIARNSAAATADVAEFFFDEAANAVQWGHRTATNVVDFTFDATSSTWQWTQQATSDVFMGAGNLAIDTQIASNDAMLGILNQTGSAIQNVSAWNWENATDAFEVTGEAYTGTGRFCDELPADEANEKAPMEQVSEPGTENECRPRYLLGTLFAIAAPGRAAIHVLVLEPTIVPFLAISGGATALTVGTLGYASAGLMYGLGSVAAGATFVGGAAAVGVETTAGLLTAGAVEAAGLAAGGVTAGVGVGATALTAGAGAALTLGNIGLNLGRLVATPALTVAGVAGSYAAGTAEVIGATALTGAGYAGITALTPLGYTAVTAAAATQVAARATRAAGEAVFWNGIVTPVGIVGNLAQAVASGAWTLVEDPILGTLNLVAAGGVVVGTVASSTGLVLYGVTKNTVLGLGHGVAATAHGGLFVAGALAKGVETTVDVFRIPRYKGWQQFRRAELVDLLDRVQSMEQAGSGEKGSMHAQASGTDFGDIHLVRIHWTGKDKGKVRNFVTKNDAGERFVFKRVVDGATCEVGYAVSNRAPIVRAFAPERAFSKTYSTGLHLEGCNK